MTKTIRKTLSNAFVTMALVLGGVTSFSILVFSPLAQASENPWANLRYHNPEFRLAPLYQSHAEDHRLITNGQVPDEKTCSNSREDTITEAPTVRVGFTKDYHKEGFVVARSCFFNTPTAVLGGKKAANSSALAVNQ